MQFQSFNFLLIFLPAIVALYYGLKSNNLRNVVLIIASFIFYAWGNALWALILMASSIVDFTLAQKIYALNLKSENSTDSSIQKTINYRRKFLLILSIVFNIGLLAFFKYWDWIVEMLGLLFSSDLKFLKHHIPLPAAISFYTFESLSYTFDIYRRQFKPTKKFLDYLTFVAFFPKLVAGPIMRAHELLPQLTKLRARVSSKNLEQALFLIFWGLFKKLVFADNLGHLVDRCRENMGVSGVGMLLGIAFAYQIYCDFSAYCDIARGVAKLFSITLKRNFLTPYFSLNMSEFFRRWNMTLSSWMRDYVFITLKKKISGKIANVANLYLTMFLIGLWHGAGIFFILYGLYAATTIAIYKIFKIDKFFINNLGNQCGKIVSMLLMFILVLYGMIIFLVKTNQDFLIISRSFFQFFALPFSDKNISSIFLDLGRGLLIFALPIFITDLLGYLKRREFVDLYPAFSSITKIFLYVLMFYLTLFFASRGSYDFIYFQF